MLDPLARRLIDPPLNLAGRAMAARGVSANVVTIVGFAVGMLAPAALALQAYPAALVLILANRLCDGLDGAIARAGRPSDLGGFLDIVLDFIFYAAVPLGFALGRPDFALPAAFLLASFMGTAASFLAFAVFAARHGIATNRRGNKALYYLGGLTEGTETIALFVACCLFPAAFPVFAYGFGLLCWITTLSRLVAGARSLRGL
jgi:phosphatidylglycerophosphate synthase